MWQLSGALSCNHTMLNIPAAVLTHAAGACSGATSMPVAEEAAALAGRESAPNISMAGRPHQGAASSSQQAALCMGAGTSRWVQACCSALISLHFSEDVCCLSVTALCSGEHKAQLHAVTIQQHHDDVPCHAVGWPLSLCVHPHAWRWRIVLFSTLVWQVTTAHTLAVCLFVAACWLLVMQVFSLLLDHS